MQKSELMRPGFVISRIMVKISRQQAKIYISHISIKVVDDNMKLQQKASFPIYSHMKEECILSFVNFQYTA